MYLQTIKTKIVWGWVVAFVFYFSIFLVQSYFDGGAWSRGLLKALAGATYMTVCVYVVVRLLRRFFPIKKNRRDAKYPRIPIINKTVPVYVVKIVSILMGMIAIFLYDWWMQSYDNLNQWVDYYKNHFSETAVLIVALYVIFEFYLCWGGQDRTKEEQQGIASAQVSDR